MTGFVHFIVALVLGAGAAFLVEDKLDAAAEPSVAGDRVLAAVEGLRDDHVHVTDGGRSMLDKEGEQAIAAAIAERDLPVYVVVWEESWFAGYDHYIQAADQILHRLDEPSIVILWQGTDTSTTRASEGYGLAYGKDDQLVMDPEYLGDPALRIPEWIDQLADEPVDEQDFDYYGGPVGGFFIGLFYGLPIVAGVWVLIGVGRLLTGRRFRNLPPKA